MAATELSQYTVDAIEDLIVDSQASIHRISYADISTIEKQKLINEIFDNLNNISNLIYRRWINNGKRISSGKTI